ncbi:hypothetical protein IL306_008705 [Fusarium sp. DS 682]|nr:hypothetical protein IL306_008705 [Fusarium sp. DS 682]
MTVQVIKLITDTMSPVLLVLFGTASGSTPAVLKLYDRRFGTHFRELNGKYKPCRSQDEAAYRSFLQQGKMRPFLEELEETYRTALIQPSASHFYEDEDEHTLPDGAERFEAALWYEADQHFKTETRAYAQLNDLQGKYIPRLYAHVRLPPPEIDADALTDMESEDYLRVHGVLMQYIPGFELRNLTKSLPVPSDISEWTAIAQRAVDAAHEINKRGVILQDSGPRNVMVNRVAKIPFIIDFAQCWFKQDLIALWKEKGYGGLDEDENEAEDGGIWNPEVEYWRRARMHNNPGSIGLVLNTYLRNAKIAELDITYPDYETIISDVKRQLETETVDI